MQHPEKHTLTLKTVPKKSTLVKEICPGPEMRAKGKKGPVRETYFGPDQLRRKPINP